MIHLIWKDYTDGYTGETRFITTCGEDVGVHQPQVDNADDFLKLVDKEADVCLECMTQHRGLANLVVLKEVADAMHVSISTVLRVSKRLNLNVQRRQMGKRFGSQRVAVVTEDQAKRLRAGIISGVADTNPQRIELKGELTGAPSTISAVLQVQQADDIYTEASPNTKYLRLRTGDLMLHKSVFLEVDGHQMEITVDTLPEEE